MDSEDPSQTSPRLHQILRVLEEPPVNCSQSDLVALSAEALSFLQETNFLSASDCADGEANTTSSHFVASAVLAGPDGLAVQEQYPINSDQLHSLPEITTSSLDSSNADPLQNRSILDGSERPAGNGEQPQNSASAREGLLASSLALEPNSSTDQVSGPHRSTSKQPSSSFGGAYSYSFSLAPATASSMQRPKSLPSLQSTTSCNLEANRKLQTARSVGNLASGDIEPSFQKKIDRFYHRPLAAPPALLNPKKLAAWGRPQADNFEPQWPHHQIRDQNQIAIAVPSSTDADASYGAMMPCLFDEGMEIEEMDISNFVEPSLQPVHVTSRSDIHQTDPQAREELHRKIGERRKDQSFPVKLYKLLLNAEAEGQTDIISFIPSGRAFKIHKPEEFLQQLVPRYFEQTKLSSFKRTLGAYGFERIPRGPEEGAYCHNDFVRGQFHKVENMKRAKRGAPTAKKDAWQPDFVTSQGTEGGET